MRQNSLKYEYGNMARQRNDKDGARQLYEESLRMNFTRYPEQMLTGCILYKLGCVKLDLGQIQEARSVWRIPALSEDWTERS